jgi:NADP-dependent 3-hydroxy acid dehydrogenase YdfG
MVDCAVAEFGRLDMAFDNAGIQVPPSDAADERIVHFERVTAVNQRGVWACMKHEQRGHVVCPGTIHTPMVAPDSRRILVSGTRTAER